MASVARRWGGIGLLLLASVSIAAGGCNALFGVDELLIDGGSGGSTATTASSSSVGGSGGLGGAGGGSDVGGAGGMSTPPTQTYELVGTGSASEMTQELQLTFQLDAPAGAMLVAIMVGRGTTPTTLGDTNNNVWMQAIEESTGSAFGVAAIYYTVLAQPHNEITISANFNISTSLARSLVLLQADTHQLLATGSQQNTGADIEVTTDSSINSDSVMMVSAVVSDFGALQTYTPLGEDEILFSFDGFLSSGAVFGLAAASFPPGPVTFMADGNTSGSSVAITAVFE